MFGKKNGLWTLGQAYRLNRYSFLCHNVTPITLGQNVCCLVHYLTLTVSTVARFVAVVIDQINY